MSVKVKWKCAYIVFLTFIFEYVTGIFEHRHCSHVHPKDHEIIRDVHIEPVHVMKKRSIDNPLRILLYYDESVYRLLVKKTGGILNTRTINDQDKAVNIIEMEGRMNETDKQQTEIYVEDNREDLSTLDKEKFELINNMEWKKLMEKYIRGHAMKDWLCKAVDDDGQGEARNIKNYPLWLQDTILPEAVHFWEQALMVRKTDSVIRLNRKCLDNQVFYRRGDPYPYCKNACEEGTMCGEVIVPEEHLEVCRTCNDTGQDCRVNGTTVGSGIDGADFVFYVSAMQTERCFRGMTVAYAAHCQQEGALDRPIAGHANLCPDSISTKPQELKILLSTVKHEILHALGFSVSLYAFYRDENGRPLTPRGENGKPILDEKLQTRQWSDKVIRKIVRDDWLVHGGRVQREFQILVTPKVVEEVRKHFNCSLLEGAELEDQGEDGTALTHWEKRIFENEAMTGTHTQNPVYSRITLALMEDTGWYKANYSMAETLTWGKNLGCDFVMKSCKEWMDTHRASGKSIHPFCNKVKQDPLKTECTEDRSSVSLCNLVVYQDILPQIYQNFDSIPIVPRGKELYYGGSVSMADYCPYTQEFTWRSSNVAVRGSHCKYPENNPQPENNFALETYGPNSKCFNNGNQEWKEQCFEISRSWYYSGSGCYEYLCQGGRLHIVVANYNYTCYKEGQVINITIFLNGWRHTGTLVCPSCEEICKEELESKGEWCKPDTALPRNFRYPALNKEDEGKCGCSTQRTHLFVTLMCLIASVVRWLRWT